MATDTTTSRYVKVPKGYPHAGRIARVVAETPDTVEVQIDTWCRTTMRGHRHYSVTIDCRDIAQVSA